HDDFQSGNGDRGENGISSYTTLFGAHGFGAVVSRVGRHRGIIAVIMESAKGRLLAIGLWRNDSRHLRSGCFASLRVKTELRTHGPTINSNDQRPKGNDPMTRSE